MKYYLYVSYTKVDMLFNQISSKFSNILRQILIELRIDLKLLTLKINSQDKENRILRLKAIVRFLEKQNKVGNVDDPNEYIQDVIPMTWKIHPTHPNAVCFYGKTEKSIIGLGGSLKHVIDQKKIETDSSGMSWNITFQKKLWDELNFNEPISSFFKNEEVGSSSFDAIYFARYEEETPNLEHKLEFFAKRLAYRRQNSKEKAIIMASPLYVALAD